MRFRAFIFPLLAVRNHGSQFFLGFALHFDGFVRMADGVYHICFAHLAHLSFHHHDVFVGGSDDEVDVAFQADDLFRRNRRLIVFDMDSTLIQTEVIDELVDALAAVLRDPDAYATPKRPLAELASVEASQLEQALRVDDCLRSRVVRYPVEGDGIERGGG